MPESGALEISLVSELRRELLGLAICLYGLAYVDLGSYTRALIFKRLAPNGPLFSGQPQSAPPKILRKILQVFSGQVVFS